MIVARLLQDMLEDLGCLVVGPATTVDAALLMIQIQRPDAALLDVNLGGQMSYPVADALVAYDVPFIFSTGYASNRLQEDYRRFPALQKPYGASELREALARALALAVVIAEPASGSSTANLAP